MGHWSISSTAHAAVLLLTGVLACVGCARGIDAEARATCQTTIDCAQATDRPTAELEEKYGEDGSCWKEESASACETKCSEQVERWNALDPLPTTCFSGDAEPVDCDQPFANVDGPLSERYYSDCGLYRGGTEILWAPRPTCDGGTSFVVETAGEVDRLNLVAFDEDGNLRSELVEATESHPFGYWTRFAGKHPESCELLEESRSIWAIVAIRNETQVSGCVYVVPDESLRGAALAALERYGGIDDDCEEWTAYSGEPSRDE